MDQKDGERTEGQVFIMSGRWGFRTWTVDDAIGENDRLMSKLRELCDDAVWQLERGVEGLVHYQLYLKLKIKIRPKTLAKALNDEFKGIELAACSSAGRLALKTYAMKDDTRIAGPWGLREVYVGQDLITQLLPWQQKLVTYLKGEPHDRQIIWICDVGGAGGKTALGKYLAFHYGALFMGWAPTKDVLNLVSKSKQSGIYIFNLTRTKPSTFQSDDLYSALEAIKDGSFMNTKYETAQVLMKPPHVVVFANQMPDKDKMSKDRWNIVNLKDVQKPVAKAQPVFMLDD